MICGNLLWFSLFCDRKESIFVTLSSRYIQLMTVKFRFLKRHNWLIQDSSWSHWCFDGNKRIKIRRVGKAFLNLSPFALSVLSITYPSRKLHTISISQEISISTTIITLSGYATPNKNFLEPTLGQLQYSIAGV